MAVYIPYGAYFSTPFARWQGSLADLHAIRLAAGATRAAIDRIGVSADMLDFAAYGWTVPQHQCFYAGPWFTALIGAEQLACPTVSQACATGARLLATAEGEIAAGRAKTALIAAGDRCSNGANVYYPAPTGPGGTGVSENWMLDNFGCDPWAGGAMIDTAENVARRDGIDTGEQHDLVQHRYAQYHEALKDDRAFQRRYMAPLDLPDPRFRKTVGRLDGDEGVYSSDPGKMAALRPVRDGGTVTFAGQTHPADGAAGMIVTDSAGRAAEIAGDGRPTIAVLAIAQAREDKGYMPAAPIAASRRALDAAGLGIERIDAVKSHNPFAVNDIAFARAYGIDWRMMNNFGSSLIWGHPQGPTGLRAMIELIEELALRGGGTGLFQGCAAGDSAMAVILRVG